MKTSVDLQKYLDDNEINGEIIFLDEATPTVETAASALGTTPDKIVKSVLFTVGSELVLAITRGPRFIERRAIAAHFNVGRKQVKLASPSSVISTTGYPVGTVPPFGYYEPIRVLMDYSVLEPSEIFAGGGAYNALLRIDPRELLSITGVTILDLHKRP
jgi:prolyl-tRNA editing enzyme YbaK/EbsC (Cys-tRNA(Pro) deacylase)